MEFFKNANIDFLGKKWYFIAFSLVFSVAGVLSMAFWHGIPLDIDFRGGTQVSVKFSHTPDVSGVHQTMDRIGYHDARIRTLGGAGSNELLIDLPQQESGKQALDGNFAIRQKCGTHDVAITELADKAISLFMTIGIREDT